MTQMKRIYTDQIFYKSVLIRFICVIRVPSISSTRCNTIPCESVIQKETGYIVLVSKKVQKGIITFELSESLLIIP